MVAQPCKYTKKHETVTLKGWILHYVIYITILKIVKGKNLKAFSL